jgi:alpha-1,6-mannosyltransferase
MHSGKKIRIFLLSTILILFIFFLLYFILPVKPIIKYTIIYISLSLGFIIFCRQILLYEIPKNFFYLLVAAAIILRIIVIPFHPTGSDDFYRYLWDGKVQANGINPYAFTPDDKELTNLHSDIIPKYVNHPAMKTLYPPLSEIYFYISYLISGESFLGVKIFLLLFDLITMLGVLLLLKKLDLNYKYLLIYAFCPLLIFQFFIDSHVDSFGFTFIVFILFFYLDNKKILSYILIGLSICIKPIGVLFIPLLLIKEKNFIERIKIVLIPAAICFAMYIPYTLSGEPFQALIKFTENWAFNGVVFNILNFFIHDNQNARLICGILFLISYIPIVLSKKDLIAKTYLSFFLLLFFSPVVHPWYVGWLVVFLPFVRKWSGIVFTSVVSLTAVTDLNYQLNGIWKDYSIVLLLEYIPVISIFLYEIFKNDYINLRKLDS